MSYCNVSSVRIVSLILVEFNESVSINRPQAWSPTRPAIPVLCSADKLHHLTSEHYDTCISRYKTKLRSRTWKRLAPNSKSLRPKSLERARKLNTFAKIIQVRYGSRTSHVSNVESRLYAPSIKVDSSVRRHDLKTGVVFVVWPLLNGMRGDATDSRLQTWQFYKNTFMVLMALPRRCGMFCGTVFLTSLNFLPLSYMFITWLIACSLLTLSLYVTGFYTVLESR